MHRKFFHNPWVRFIFTIICPALLAVTISIGSVYVVIIPAFRDSFMDSKRAMLKELARVTISALELCHRSELAGNLTREQAQQKALEQVENLRYGPKGKDYFWINDMKPQLIMHPYSKELIGTNLIDYETPGGSFLFRQILSTLEGKNSGYIEYIWDKKYGFEQTVKKLSYVQKFEPWGWVIGTGVFLDDVNAKTREITDRLSMMVYSATALIALLLFYVTLHSLFIERKRRETEKNLAESEQKYRALVEAAVEPIMMLYKGRVIYANKAMEQLLDYKAEELETMELEKLMASEQPDASFTQLLYDLKKDEETAITHDLFEVKLLARENVTVATELAVTGKTIAGQRVLAMSVRDMSLVKQVEKQLGESRERFRKLTTDLNIGVFRVSAEPGFDFLEVNSTVASLAGVSSETSLLSTGLSAILEQEGNIESIETMLQRETRIRARTFKLKSGKGKDSIVSLSMALVSDESGKPLYYDGFMVDVSAYKRREKQRDGVIAELQTSLLFLNQPIRPIAKPYIACSMNTTVQQAATIMTREDRNAILIESESGKMMGIVTDKTLRQRVLSSDVPATCLVYEVMSAPLHFIEDTAFIYEALLKIHDENVEHLVVRENSGKIISVVSNEELLDVHRYSSTFMLNEIKNGDSVAEIKASHDRMPHLIKALSDSGAHAKNITRIITRISDTVTVRLIELAIDQLGPPPANFGFISLGSEGRGEQTLATDQDNAIIYALPEPDYEEETHEYFLQMGKLVCTWLDEVGYDFCKGNIMAMNPQWCQPVSRWQEYFRNWIRESSPDDLMEVSIFFDFRTIYGDESLADELRTFVRKKTEKQLPFFIQLARNTLSFRIPVDFFGKLSAEDEGEFPETFNIKHAMAVLTGYARIYAINHGMSTTNTLNRIDLLLQKGLITAETHRELIDAYDYLMQLRFKHQVACIDRGDKPNNHIHPEQLSHMEKEVLEKVFAHLGDVRKQLSKIGKSEMFF